MFNFFKDKIKKFSGRILKLKSVLGNKINALFSKKIEESSFDELEKILYEADLGVESALFLVDKLRAQLNNTEKEDPAEIIHFIKKELLDILATPPAKNIEAKPFIIMIVGVNGSGKTTSIAKLAALYKNEGKNH